MVNARKQDEVRFVEKARIRPQFRFVALGLALLGVVAFVYYGLSSGWSQGALIAGGLLVTAGVVWMSCLAEHEIGVWSEGDVLIVRNRSATSRYRRSKITGFEIRRYTRFSAQKNVWVLTASGGEPIDVLLANLPVLRNLTVDRQHELVCEQLTQLRAWLAA